MKDIFYFILGASVGAIFALLFAPPEWSRAAVEDSGYGRTRCKKRKRNARPARRKAQAQWQAGQEKTHKAGPNSANTA